MRTIVVVDDEKEMRERYQKLLTSKGFTVIEAPDAVEMASILLREKNNIDLILLDINIAEVDGRDIFDIINEYAPSLQVIVSSVLPVSEQRIRIRRAADYYDKSQKESVLLAKIRNVLGITEEA